MREYWSDMNDGKLELEIERLRTRVYLGGAPLIVIGSGLSAGVGAPTMELIHAYLEEKIEPEHSTTTKAVRDLIKILREEAEYPRSVSVRLYHLLQTSPDEKIRSAWAKFGIELLAGQLAAGMNPLWDLQPSAGHRWVAQLALRAHAIVMSLNFDGLTQKAVDQAAPGRCRVLSSATEIATFFTGSPPPGTTSPVPIIKVRGDVFHAVCENGRCPDLARSVPIYELWRSEYDDPPDDRARRYLRCPTCGELRGLQISFPGVFGKEQAIDESLAALHRIHGSRIAGVMFLGFSGRWDDALVRYLTERSAHLGVPVLSFALEQTPAIARAAEDARARYHFESYQSIAASLGDANDPKLCRFIDPAAISQHQAAAEAYVGRSGLFPAVAFSGLNCGKELTIDLADPAMAASPSSVARAASAIRFVPDSVEQDTMALLAHDALRTSELERLAKCSQLGPKSSFICEKTAEHTRFHHSASAGLLALCWYGALSRDLTAGWDATFEAQLTLELATLFHDARHLPFSHLMEEVFRELNWGFPSVRGFEGIPQSVDRVIPSMRGDFGRHLEEALRKEGLKVELEEWWKTRVVALQEGRVGSPWLEAIVDSALDVDKIQYIFHDSLLTGQSIRLSDLKSWFGDFLSGQSLTPEGLIRLEGEAPFAASALLQERMYLYRHLYLAPELRALEALVRHIIISWLEWKVPEMLGDVSRMSKSGTGYDLRSAKATAAATLLWGMFQTKSSGVSREMEAVQEMVTDLTSSASSDATAKDTIHQAWSILSVFRDAAPATRPTLRLARERYLQLRPIGPFYCHARHAATVRRICRLVRVHLPLVGLIDIAQFPRFLPTPTHRQWGRAGNPTTAEQFLVPGVNPSEWRRRGYATTPLAKCELASFELPIVQVLVFDPFGNAGGSSAFTYDMVRRQLRDAGVDIRETPEEAAKLGPPM